MSVHIPTGGASRRARLRDVLVVDVDVHVLDEAAALAPYCDQPWRRVLEERQNVPPLGGMHRSYPIFPGHFSTRKYEMPTPAEVRAGLDELSIDIGVLFPEKLLAVARQPNAEYAMALMRAYNRFLLDQYLGERGLYGVIGVAPQDVPGSIAEIERYAREERMVGVMLPTTRLEPLWGDRRFDPIYQLAEQLGLPIFYHGGAPVQVPMLPFELRQFDSPFMFHTYTHSIEMMTTLANLMATGLPARFPKLRFIFIEAGISWVPHAMMRLDRYWEEMRGDVPFLEERPSAYMRRQMFFATQPIEEPDPLRDMVDVLRIIDGHRTVLFASDYPHHDFDHPKKVFDIPLPPEVKRRIMAENALQLLGIPTPAPAERIPGKTLPAAG
jgi:predicted TIM-barrel fold metal-dependent hydrolase